MKRHQSLETTVNEKKDTQKQEFRLKCYLELYSVRKCEQDRPEMRERKEETERLLRNQESK